MIRSITVALVCYFALGLAQAQAHFMWMDLKPAGGGQGQALVYFGELPEPGEPHLIGKIAHAKAWVRHTDSSADLKIAPAADKDLPVFVAPCPAQPAASLEATCDYGIYQRGKSGMLLQYYAKHLSGDWQREAGKLARAERLPLDIVPSLADGQLKLEVLYQGKPSRASEVIVVDPAGKEFELKTGDDGRVSLPRSAKGRYAIRAAHLEADRSGERDGKAYGQTGHYCTLTLDLPAATAATAAAASATNTPAAAEVPATEALRRARSGRSVWQNFPGFTADLDVYAAGKQTPAKLTIDADGVVALEMPESPLADWAEEQLNSLVQHRMPDGEVTEGKVTYADEDTTHPLGRKINLGDPSLQSVYRVKEDVINEVNRSAGPMRFTISVLEITRNPENKYLPRSFTMTFFDAASGQLKMTLAYWNDWQRIEKFDLPKTILEIGTHPGGTATKQIVFKNCKLLPVAKK